MEDILDVGDGFVWKRLETEADAEAAMRATNTAIHVYFKIEEERGTGVRFYALTGPGTDPWPVCASVNDKAGRYIPAPEKVTPTLVTGHNNRDPYPEHAAAIKALGERLGVDLSGRYPYGPRPEEAGGSGPTP